MPRLNDLPDENPTAFDVLNETIRIAYAPLIGTKPRVKKVQPKFKGIKVELVKVVDSR